MNNNIRAGVGFLIPAVAIIAFFSSILAENYLLGIFFATAGVLVWFLYAAIMQSELPDVTGNVIIVFGFLLSSAVLLKYGWETKICLVVLFLISRAPCFRLCCFFSLYCWVCCFETVTHPAAFLQIYPLLLEPQVPPAESTVDPTLEEDQTSKEGGYDGYNSEAYEAYYSDYYDYYNENGADE